MVKTFFKAKEIEVEELNEKKPDPRFKIELGSNCTIQSLMRFVVMVCAALNSHRKLRGERGQLSFNGFVYQYWEAVIFRDQLKEIFRWYKQVSDLCQKGTPTEIYQNMAMLGLYSPGENPEDGLIQFGENHECLAISWANRAELNRVVRSMIDAQPGLLKALRQVAYRDLRTQVDFDKKCGKIATYHFSLWFLRLLRKDKTQVQVSIITKAA